MDFQKLEKDTLVQWLWIDMGHTQIAQYILEWGDNPVINMVDHYYYMYFNMRYLGSRPFQNLQLPDGQVSSIASTTSLSEITRWARNGRSGAGASSAMGMSDVAAYFNAVIMPIMLAQSGIKSELLNTLLDSDRVVVAPMATTMYNTELHQYVDDVSSIIPTLYMGVINLSPILSRNWLQSSDMLCQSKSILLDILPGIERSQIYGPASSRSTIKDYLTAAEFNLGNAMWSHFTHNYERQQDNINIPIHCTANAKSHSGYTSVIFNGKLRLGSAFSEITPYFPNFVIVWSNYNCHDMGNINTSLNVNIDDHTNANGDNVVQITNAQDKHMDMEYKLDKRSDKIACNDTMLKSNAVLARMMYMNMRTHGELKRNEIIRSPLLVSMEKERDKKKRAIYRKHCGSGTYHYITNTERYRALLVSSKPKAVAATASMVSQLSEQLAKAKLY